MSGRRAGFLLPGLVIAVSYLKPRSTGASKSRRAMALLDRE